MRFVTLLVAALLTLPTLSEAQTTTQTHAHDQAAPHAERAASAAVWESLVRGNRAFAGGRIAFNDLTAQRTQLRSHQSPATTVLSCSDSRVPPELVFNQPLGSLFVIRTAGNVADDFGLASIEYAIAHGFTSLIVVLGHESCGAVQAAVDPTDPATPSLRALVERIRMSFAGVPWNTKERAMLQRAIEMNARAAAAALPAQSSVIRDAAMNGRVQIVPAYYDFGTGQVRRLD